MQLHLLKLRGKRGLQTTGVQFNSEQNRRRRRKTTCMRASYSTRNPVKLKVEKKPVSVSVTLHIGCDLPLQPLSVCLPALNKNQPCCSLSVADSFGATPSTLCPPREASALWGACWDEAEPGRPDLHFLESHIRIHL